MKNQNLTRLYKFHFFKNSFFYQMYFQEKGKRTKKGKKSKSVFLEEKQVKII